MHSKKFQIKTIQRTDLLLTDWNYASDGNPINNLVKIKQLLTLRANKVITNLYIDESEHIP